MPWSEVVELDLAEQDQDAVDDRGRAAERRERPSPAGSGRRARTCATAKIAPRIRPTTRAMKPGPEAEPLEEADAEHVADGAAEDHDRRRSTRRTRSPRGRAPNTSPMPHDRTS